ncbi:tripartite tricarboxylate transporter substrate binding protein [Peribacillus cavernae]|uniref:Tripartite tricarboxylate transporter substrate binding protein n=1 Tax=Peribacillus cavernae TaxID=1674310 RepID=A0A433HWT6_9BACI|nr:tripartite tricarboxylate transporter substrate binding protein [Peribacillus cavernae]MDQ0221139.1 tripartite-type tricarboxylate transporter receptor subunit TctC [Peribacillus cavernae]RUQ32821.1 tripartite tricarboxylate transporter substrate binding protein [Peribacillus cavernae]
MKKLILSLLLISLVALTACGNGGSQETSSSKESKAKGKSNFPNKPITLIVSFEAGGGTDTGARTLMPYVEKELGVPITVVNKPGAGGWVGWSELARAKPDGYTIGYINTPNLITGYVNPSFKRKENLDSFELIANHVTDVGAIAVRKDDDRFKDINDLVELAKKKQLTTTSTGVGSDDHFAAVKMNKNLGTKFEAVHTKGFGENLSNILGGHVDVMFANVGEVVKPQEEGQLKVLAVMLPERSPLLPDVPTLKEAGMGDISSASARGIAVPKGMDKENLDILRAAFEKGIKNAKHQEKMEDMGLLVDFRKGDDYTNMLKDEEANVNNLKELLGW